MKKIFGTLCLSLLWACNGLPVPPIVIPTPPPSCPATCPEGQECTDPAKGCVPKPPPPPECLPAVPWCNELVPPATCSTPSAPCKHNPSSDPLHCELAPACPVVPPEPPTEPPPTGTCIADEFKMTVVGSTPTMTAPVVAAIKKLQAFEGQAPRVMLQALAAQLNTDGYCAFAGQEAVFVKTTSGLWDEFHAVFFNDGVHGQWILTGKYMATHKADEPPPPSAPGCSAPITPRVNQWGLVLRNRFWDSTPLFYNGEALTWAGVPVTGYCNAIGFQRVFCPARMECEEGKDNFKCEERRACEGYGIGGYPTAVPLFRCESGTPEVNEGGFGARCPAGSRWIEVCDTAGLNCTRELTL